MAVDLEWSYSREPSQLAKFQDAGMGITRLFHGGRQQNNKTKQQQLIDFRGCLALSSS